MWVCVTIGVQILAPVEPGYWLSAKREASFTCLHHLFICKSWDVNDHYPVVLSEPLSTSSKPSSGSPSLPLWRSLQSPHSTSISLFLCVCLWLLLGHPEPFSVLAHVRGRGQPSTLLTCHFAGIQLHACGSDNITTLI